MAKEFTGVWIPKAIYQMHDITPVGKLILADIFNLCKSSDGYFKSNETIAKEVGVSVTTVSRTIKHLVLAGMINSSYDGRTRLIKLTRALAKLTKQTYQIDKADLSNRPHSIHSSIQLKKHISKEVVLPFESDEFKNTWDIWIDERKQQKRKKYTERGEKATLHNLQKISNNNEKQAIKIIKQSITQGWAGLFALKGGAERKQLNAEQALKWAYGK